MDLFLPILTNSFGISVHRNLELTIVPLKYHQLLPKAFLIVEWWYITDQFVPSETRTNAGPEGVSSCCYQNFNLESNTLQRLKFVANEPGMFFETSLYQIAGVTKEGKLS